MAVGAAFVAHRGDGVGEGEELGFRPALAGKPFEEEGVFVIEHRQQPLTGNITLARAVDGVADGHVVGGHAFGDGAGRRADPEEPANDFLTGADLRKGAVFPLSKIDRQRFLMNFDQFPFHQPLRPTNRRLYDTTRESRRMQPVETQRGGLVWPPPRVFRNVASDDGDQPPVFSVFTCSLTNEATAPLQH